VGVEFNFEHREPPVLYSFRLSAGLHCSTRAGGPGAEHPRMASR
jgi:hypothetical protein